MEEHLKLNGNEMVFVEYKTDSYVEQGVTVKNINKKDTQTLELIRTIYNSYANGNYHFCNKSQSV